MERVVRPAPVTICYHTRSHVSSSHPRILDTTRGSPVRTGQNLPATFPFRHGVLFIPRIDRATSSWPLRQSNSDPSQTLVDRCSARETADYRREDTHSVGSPHPTTLVLSSAPHGPSARRVRPPAPQAADVREKQELNEELCLHHLTFSLRPSTGDRPLRTAWSTRYRTVACNRREKHPSPKRSEILSLREYQRTVPNGSGEKNSDAVHKCPPPLASPSAVT